MVHAGEAVVPAEAFFVEPGPEETQAEGGGGHDGTQDAAAHGFASGVLVGEGAEGDAGVVHAGRGFAEGKEEQVVEGPEEGEGRCGADGCGGQADGDGRRCGVDEVGRGEAGGCDDKAGEGDEGGEDDGSVDAGGHEAKLDGGDLGVGLGDGGGGVVGFELRGGEFSGAGVEVGDRVSVEEDGGPDGGDGFGGGRGGDLGRLDLEDAELGGVRCGAGVLAEWAFGDAGAGAAGGDELARELDEIGGEIDGCGGGVFEDGGLAEGDLFVECESVGFVECLGQGTRGRSDDGVDGRGDLFHVTDC